MAADYSTADQRGNPNSTWLPPDGSKMSGLRHFRVGRLSVSLRESASGSGLPHASWIPNSGSELTNRRSTRQTKAARRETSNPRASDSRAERGRFASWSGWTLCWPSVLKSTSHIAAVQIVRKPVGSSVCRRKTRRSKNNGWYGKSQLQNQIPMTSDTNPLRKSSSEVLPN